MNSPHTHAIHLALDILALATIAAFLAAFLLWADAITGGL
jgi:hypothetical protein